MRQQSETAMKEGQPITTDGAQVADFKQHRRGSRISDDISTTDGDDLARSMPDFKNHRRGSRISDDIDVISTTDCDDHQEPYRLRPEKGDHVQGDQTRDPELWPDTDSEFGDCNNNPASSSSGPKRCLVGHAEPESKLQPPSQPQPKTQPQPQPQRLAPAGSATGAVSSSVRCRSAQSQRPTPRAVRVASAMSRSPSRQRRAEKLSTLNPLAPAFEPLSKAMQAAVVYRDPRTDHAHAQHVMPARREPSRMSKSSPTLDRAEWIFYDAEIPAGSKRTSKREAQVDSAKLGAQACRGGGSSAPLAADVPITTVMIRNLPKMVSQRYLLREVEMSGYKGRFDFCYLPTDFNSGRCKGYAFLNFGSPADAADFILMWHHSRRLGIRDQDPALEVSAAHIQGRDANAKVASSRSKDVRSTDSSRLVMDRPPPQELPQRYQELFLPKFFNSEPVLVHLGGRRYRVDNSRLQARSSGLGYRYTKDLSNKSTTLAKWNSVVEGIDDGGWVKVLLRQEEPELAPPPPPRRPPGLHVLGPVSTSWDISDSGSAFL